MLLSDAPRRQGWPLEYAKRVYKARRRKPGIVLSGLWRCDPQTATRAELRKFLAAGFRELQRVTTEELLDEDDRARLFALAFTLFSKAEEVIWQDVRIARQEDEETDSEGDVIQFSDEDARALREIAQEQEAATRAIMELTWKEEPARPEAEITTKLENYSL